MKNLIKRMPIVSFLLIILFTACTGNTTSDEAASQTDRATIIVYRSPT